WFFFQAEGGIRDFHVTGVQTCALPIYFGRDGVIRTLDPLHPMQVRYQAALRPEMTAYMGNFPYLQPTTFIAGRPCAYCRLGFATASKERNSSTYFFAV